MAMTTSAAGREAIRKREGVRFHAYRDSIGVLTIGVGHTGRASPPDVYEGMVITQSNADVFLAADLKPFEAAVNGVFGDREATQAQFDATVSLVFNIGVKNFETSTVARELAAGNLQAAADAFLSWDRAGGRVLQGLLARRSAERTQFLGLSAKRH